MSLTVFTQNRKWIGLLTTLTVLILLLFIITRPDYEAAWSLPPGESGNYFEIQISPDGQSLLGVKNNCLELFDLKTKQRYWQIEKGFLPAIAWFDNERVLAVPSERAWDLTVYSREKGTQLEESIYAAGCIDVCCCGELVVGTGGHVLKDFSGFGQPFVLRRADLREFVFKNPDGEVQRILDCDDDSGRSITACRIEDDQYRIAVTYDSHCPAKICTLTMTEESANQERCPPFLMVDLIQEFAVPEGSRVALSEDGRFLVILSSEGLIKYDWASSDYQQESQFKTSIDVNAYGKCLAISPDGRWVACCTGRDVLVLCAADLQISSRIRSVAYALCFSPDSRQLAIARDMGVAGYLLRD
ncbi:hypothetical protein [Gimesia sp.]|uniref:WD40 repeat domain-containing protein n=1 Tax=Gimesia sp. TaxID=2024833 RepID=UPI0032EEE9C9